MKSEELKIGGSRENQQKNEESGFALLECVAHG